MGKPAATDRPRLTPLRHSFTLENVARNYVESAGWICVRSDALGFRGGVFPVLGRRPAQTGHVDTRSHIIMTSKAGGAQMKLMYFALNNRWLISAKIATTANFSRRLRLPGANVFLQETSFH